MTVYDENVGISYGYFISENDECYGGDTTGGNSGEDTSDPIPNTPETALGIIAMGLEECEGEKPWLSNLFGTTKVCIDKYDSKHRVKVKYYNLDLYLAYVMGVKVKHQKKGWTGFWRKQDADEIALGLNSVSWKFNRTKALSITISPIKFHILESNIVIEKSYYHSINNNYAGQSAPIPPLPFVDDADMIVELFTNDFGFLESEYEVRELFYSYIYDEAKGILKRELNKDLKKLIFLLHSDKPKPNTVHKQGNYETWVQYYDFAKIKSNESKIEKVFDWGVATPKFTFSIMEGSSFMNLENIEFDMDFRNPKATGINAFGMANKNGEWYGKRLVFDEKD